jgi:23S rRNA pseudouridine1911/1915/1917 synthase
MPLSVVYEDIDMLVVDKPPGVAVHPAPGHEEHTLVHALVARYPRLPGIAGTERPGIVHRLDLDTSGLLMVAKSDRGALSLSAQLETRKVKKGYLALLKGSLKDPRGVVDAPIGRDPFHRKKMAVVGTGRPSRTAYQELDAFDGLSFCLARPETGRTHQIRVHFEAIGAPVAGDELYGGTVEFLGRQFLHSAFLIVARPSDGLPIRLKSELPSDLRSGLESVMASRGVDASEIARRIDAALLRAEIEFFGEPVHRQKPEFARGGAG